MKPTSRNHAASKQRHSFAAKYSTITYTTKHDTPLGLRKRNNTNIHLVNQMSTFRHQLKQFYVSFYTSTANALSSNVLWALVVVLLLPPPDKIMLSGMYACKQDNVRSCERHDLGSKWFYFGCNPGFLTNMRLGVN